jgi:hypothetical protein
MSYSCEISFKSLDAKDIFPFLQKFKEFMNQHIQEIAKENFHYCPMFKKRLYAIPDFLKIPKEDIEEAKNWVVNAVFKFRYFYDDKRGLLGIYGVPSCASQLFDGSVHFQNSTDQDYTKEVYKGIKTFEEIFDYWYSMNEETFFKSYYEKHNKPCDRDFLDDEEPCSKDYQESFEYIKRSVIYKEIWEPISDTLFNDKTALYLSLYSGNDTSILYSFIGCCHEEQLKWENKFYKKQPAQENFNQSSIEDEVLDR